MCAAAMHAAYCSLPDPLREASKREGERMKLNQIADPEEGGRREARGGEEAGEGDRRTQEEMRSTRMRNEWTATGKLLDTLSIDKQWIVKSRSGGPAQDGWSFHSRSAAIQHLSCSVSPFVPSSV